MNKDLVAIFEYLEREKGIKREVVIKAIEDSLVAAARKSVKGVGEVTVQINSKTGDIEVLTQKEIVESVEFPEEEISIEEAKDLAPNAEIGQWLEMVVTPTDFGRIAAQAARQVIGQKLRSAERDVIYEEYRHRTGEIISGSIKRFVRGRNVIVDLGKVEAILPERNYPRTERYHVGEKLQALLLEVRDKDDGGAEVVLSRSHPDFVAQLFSLEVPELADGSVTIEKIVRDAGYRTKIAVKSYDTKIDPVGTCVGVRGSRIKNIIRELNNEKIDIIPYSDDKVQLLENAISPIEVQKLKMNQKISIVVNDDDYPAVIGKKGMNARLLGQLLETEIEVQKISEYQKLVTIQMAELAEDQETQELDQPLQIEGLSSLIREGLISSGFDTLRKIAHSSPNELTTAVPGLNYYDLADKILEQLHKKRV
ncbi:MAG: transcription termination factor NusA [Chlamydiota bacterium]|jgi:N utilization substance protein A